MLIQHAEHFRSDMSLEAEVLCELEWDQTIETRLL